MNYSIDQLEKNLKDGKISPVYVFHGDESFFYENLIKKLEEKIIPKHDKPFNQFVKYGKDLNVQTLIGDVRRFPMMAECQMVIVKNAQLIQGFNEKQNQKQIEQYLSNPIKSTVLILQFDDALDERKAWIKNANADVAFCLSKKMYDNKLPEWLGAY